MYNFQSLHIVQKMIVLAGGVPASESQRLEMVTEYYKQGEWQRVARVIDENLNISGTLARDGESAVIRTLAENGFDARLTDAEAHEIVHTLKGQGVDSLARLFEYLCLELEGPLGDILNQRAEAANHFTNLLITTDKSLDYEGSQVRNAARNWTSAIGSSEASLQAAIASAEDLVGRFDGGNLKATLIACHIAGATVFIDVDGDGVQDDDEPATFTDARGNFLFEGDLPSGLLVSRGGVDMTTGQPFSLSLTAPAGASVVTPLTTLLQQILVQAPRLSLSDAQDILFQSLRLPTVELCHCDLLSLGLQANASADDAVLAVRLLSATVQVMNLQSIVAALMGTFAPEADPLSQQGAALRSLAIVLVEAAASGQMVDLAEEESIARVVMATAQESKVLLPGSPALEMARVQGLAEQTGQILAQVNQLTRDMEERFTLDTDPNASLGATLAQVFALQTLAGTQISQSIQRTGGGDLSRAVADFTCNALLGLIARIGQSNPPTAESAPPPPPTPLLAPVLSLANDSGHDASDGVTRQGEFWVAGLQAGARWQYTLDGGMHWHEGAGSGFAVDADGSYDVRVRQFAANGKTSAQGYLPGLSFPAATTLRDLDLAMGFRITYGLTQSTVKAGGFLLTVFGKIDMSGDINHDGYSDVVLGWPGRESSKTTRGNVYVLFGGPADGNAVREVVSLTGDDGVHLSNLSLDDYLGTSVASGDLNGDGIDDLVMSAASAPGAPTNAGAVYVLYGTSAGFPAHRETVMLDGRDGFVILGGTANDRAGNAVAVAGDVNGDGLADLLIGAQTYGSSQGTAYVVYGSAAGFPASISLSALDGTNGFQIVGTDRVRLGSSVSAAGDVNGDGLGDIILGAYWADPAGIGSGAAYVLFGNAAGFPSQIHVASLNGQNGFSLKGVVAGALVGSTVSGTGDINGDGCDDVLVGAFRDTAGANTRGAAYVVFGRQDGFDASLSLDALDGTNGFKLLLPDRVWLGVLPTEAVRVSEAGDVNGDGMADILIADHFAGQNGARSGSVYVLFGNRAGFSATYDLGTLDGRNGFRLDGSVFPLDGFGTDMAGASLAGGGDFNGDGLKDMLVATSAVSTIQSGGSAGTRYTDDGNTYLVYGSPGRVIVDTTAPGAVSLTLVEVAEAGADRVTVASLEAEALWDYSLDNGSTWVSGIGESFALGEGRPEEVRVRQVDVAGNESAHAVLGAVVALPSLQSAELVDDHAIGLVGITPFSP